MPLLKLEENELYGGYLNFLEALDVISKDFGTPLVFSDPAEISRNLKIYGYYKNGDVFKERLRLRESSAHEVYNHYLTIYSISKDSVLETENGQVPVDYMVVFWDCAKKNPLDTTVYFSGTDSMRNSGAPIITKYVDLMKKRLKSKPLKTIAMCEPNQ